MKKNRIPSQGRGGDSTEGEDIGQPGEEQAEDAGKEKTEETAEEPFFSGEREVYESDDGSRVETCRNGDTVTVTVTDAQGRSVTVTEEGGKKSLHFDGLDPNDPDTEALLKKFRIGNTETPDGNGMEEPLESFDGVPVKKKEKSSRIREKEDGLKDRILFCAPLFICFWALFGIYGIRAG